MKRIYSTLLFVMIQIAAIGQITIPWGGTEASPSPIDITTNTKLTGRITIESGRHVRIYSSNGSKITPTSNVSLQMFHVKSGASLTLENITIEGRSDSYESLTIVENEGTLIIKDGAILTKTNRGGIINRGGAIHMSGGSITGNHSYSSGGGISNFNHGTVTISGGSIANNSCSNKGGGIFNTGTLYISGGIISGNTSNDKIGHEIYSTNENGGYDGILNISAKPIVGNSSSYTNGLCLGGTAVVALTGDLQEGANINFEKPVNSESGRVIVQKSSALTAVEITTFKDKGFDRHVIVNSSDNTQLILDELKFDLQVAIDAATGTPASPSVIIVTENIELSKAVSVTSGKGVILKGINGNSTIIARRGDFTNQMIGVPSTSALIIDEITIDGQVTANAASIIGNAGKVELRDGARLINSQGALRGGAISNNGSLIVRGGEIKGNSAGKGGAIYSSNSATLLVEGGTIKENSASEGGGIYCEITYRTVEINGGTITNNSATSLGGGIYSFIDGSGSITMKDATLTGNTAGDCGGGIYSKRDNTYENNFEIKNSTISNNRATNLGGGIYNHTGKIVLEDVTINGNKAVDGAGIYNTKYLTLVSGNISNNAASNDGGGIYNADQITVNNGSISGNTAMAKGGGVYNAATDYYNSAIFKITKGSITNNSAVVAGNGVYNAYFAKTQVSGTANIGSVTDNNGICLALYDRAYISYSLNAGAYIGIEVPEGTVSAGRVLVEKEGSNLTDADLKMLHYKGEYLAFTRETSNGRYAILTVTPLGLQELINASNGTAGSPEVINIGKVALDLTTTITVPTGKHVQIKGNSIWGPKNASFNLFKVESGASLILENIGVYGSAYSTEPTGGSLIYNEGTLSLKDGALLRQNKSSVNGAGIYNNNGHIELNGGEIIYCETSGEGGAIYSTGTINITDVLIENCRAENNGGGVYSTGTINFAGGVIKTCSSYRGDGGGIYSAGTVTVSGGELSDNIAKSGSELYSSGQLNASGQLILGATGQNRGIFLAGTTKINLTANLQSGSNINIEKLDNPTEGRVVVEKASALLPSDIAAIHYRANNGELVVNTLNDKQLILSASMFDLQAAIDAADGDFENPTVITLPEDIILTTTINVPYQKNVAIDGNGKTITRKADFSGIMFLVDDEAYTAFENITIDGSCVGGVTGPIIYNRGTLLVKDGAKLLNNSNNSTGMSAVKGGAIYNCGNLHLIGGEISGNSSYSGGAIYHDTYESNSFTIEGTTISGNSATDGGGVYLYRGKLALKDGVISGNTATNGGGILNEYGTLIMQSGTIAYNIATYGGGIENKNLATFNMTGGVINNNSASSNGGGLYNNHGTVSISGGSINGNTCLENGNEVYSYKNIDISYNPRIGTSDSDGGVYFNFSSRFNFSYLATGAFFNIEQPNGAAIGYVIANKNGGANITSEELSCFNYTATDLTLKMVNDQIQLTTIVTLNVNTNPGSGGTVAGSGVYFHGAEVTLTAIPAKNYYFVEWRKDGSTISNANPYNFTIDGDVTLEAVFAYRQYTITVNTDPVSAGTAMGGGNYTYGTSATLKTAAYAGYNFLGWQENGVTLSRANPYTFTVVKDQTITAKYVQGDYTLAAIVSPAGSGTVSGEGAYTANTTATLAATPNTGSTFEGWYKNGIKVGDSNSYSIIMTEDLVLEARFTVNSHTVGLNANPSIGGIVTGGGTYFYGEDVQVEATAAAGYNFIEWKKGGVNVSNANPYSFLVTENVSLEAIFALSQNTISVNVYPTIGGTIEGIGNYVYNSIVTLTANPIDGYRFVGWKKGGVTVSSDNPYNFTAAEDVILEAEFAIGIYTINLSAIPTIGGTLSGGGSHNYNTQATLTATPAYGYRFIGWKKDDIDISTANPYLHTVTEDTNITAEFEPIGHLAGLNDLTVNGVEHNIADTYIIDCGESSQLSIMIGKYDDAALESEHQIGENQLKINVNKFGISTYSFTLGIVGTDYKQEHTITVERKLDFNDYIVQQWNNTLMLNLKKLREDGYNIVSYKWYKNGVQDGSGSYYSAGPTANHKLDFTAHYHVVLTLSDGTTLSSCAIIPVQQSVSVIAYPNPVVKGGKLNIKLDEDSGLSNSTVVNVYNLSGVKQSSSVLNSNNNMIVMPNAPGIYLVELKNNGLNQTFKVIVQ